MTRTEHYQLPQWEAYDPVRRADFNGAMAALDTALEALDSKADGVGGAASNALAQARQELETKISAVRTTANAAQAAANAAWSPDNAPYALGTYRGTGTSGADDPCQITVGFRPSALLICPAMAKQGAGLDGKTVTPPSHFFALSPSDSGSPSGTVTWLDDGVAWYSGTVYNQCNESGNTYFYIVFR